MYNVIPTVVSVVFTQNLQRCNQIELEGRTHLRFHQDKSLSGLSGAWTRTVNQSVIRFNMLNIHTVYHSVDVYLLWIFTDSTSCLDVGVSLYFALEHLCCLVMPSPWRMSMSVSCMVQHFDPEWNISNIGWIASDICASLTYPNDVGDPLYFTVALGWHFWVKYLDSCSVSAIIRSKFKFVQCFCL